MNKTKSALGDSLKKMLHKKPFHKITVADITDGCGLNRMSFYYHFQDINDLVEWTLKEDLQKAINRRFVYESWKEGYLAVFELMIQNKYYFLTMYQTLEKERIRNTLLSCFHDYIYKIIDSLSFESKLTKEEKSFLADFYKHAFVGIMMDWFDHDMKEPPQEVIKKVDLIMHGNMHPLIHRFDETYHA